MNVASRLAAAVLDLWSLHDRVLVGIDGPDAAGKTTLAGQLASCLEVPVVQASIDDFRPPVSVRRRRGELSPEGYYLDGFDYEVLRHDVLEPFRAGAPGVRVGDRIDVPARAVLVVDGVFLQRPELREFWTLCVYLRISSADMLHRGLERDSPFEPGPVADLEQRYIARYLPGQALYRADVDPQNRADIVIDNTDLSSPEVIRWDVTQRST